MCSREKGERGFHRERLQSRRKKRERRSDTFSRTDISLWITAGRRDEKQLWHSVQTLHIWLLWSKVEFYTISNSIQGLLLYLFAKIFASVQSHKRANHSNHSDDLLEEITFASLIVSSVTSVFLNTKPPTFVDVQYLFTWNFINPERRFQVLFWSQFIFMVYLFRIY